MSEGSAEVDRRMEPVKEAIYRHLDWRSNGATDIYNRAYEAVSKALNDRLDREIKKAIVP